MRALTQEEKDSLLDLIEQSSGFIVAIAQTKGVHRRTVEKWIAAYPELKEAMRNARENTKDFAESVLLKRMKSDNENVSLKAACYYLDTQAKDRGYGYKKVDVTSGGAPLGEYDKMDNSELKASIERNLRLLGYERTGDGGQTDFN